MNSEEKKTKYENPKLIDLNEEFGTDLQLRDCT
jgi:hypothetical protein